MKIDLFGGTGFIGSRFQEKFPDSCYLHPREDNLPKYENILYMISTTDNYNLLEDPYVDIKVNLIKLIEVLENCRNKNIVFNFISSWFVYGKTNDYPVTEDSFCNPTGFYSITKKCAEDLLISYCKTFNIKYRIIRLCNVYGPGDKRASKKKNALQYLINEIKNDRPIKLYNNGEFYRDYLYIDDVCDAIHLCLNEAPLNDIINISSGKPQKFKDIIMYVLEKTKSKSEIGIMEPTYLHKLVQIENMYIDNSKLKSLGFKPKFSIYEGVDNLL